ncbi:MAG: zinc ABC transporter substrate-binding protein [Planctomycetota bacterium]|nr:zinc ABC transporter substrate-binding protein [Planctomycetota bacterium]
MMRLILTKGALQRTAGAWSRASLALGLLVPLTACGEVSGGPKAPLVVITTGQIHDAAQALVEGVEVELKLLCGPGVDPHGYGASTRDVLAMDKADLIVFNGFHLEAQLSDLLEREAIAAKSWSMASAFPAERRLGWSEGGVSTDNFDPHIWNDLEGWSSCVAALSLELTELFPESAEQIKANAAAYGMELLAVDQWARQQLGELPESRRVLVSGHDAFSYFARNYGLETLAILGVGNDPEADLLTMRSVAERVVEKEVPVVFLESVTNPRLTQALLEACEARGWNARIADAPLYSDDLGAEAPVDTFLGAFRANVETIFTALGTS